ESIRDLWAPGKNRRRKDLRTRISGYAAPRVPSRRLRQEYVRARLVQGGARCPRKPTESERIFQASRFSHVATQAKWPRAAPIRQAFCSRAKQPWDLRRLAWIFDVRS